MYVVFLYRNRGINKHSIIQTLESKQYYLCTSTFVRRTQCTPYKCTPYTVQCTARTPICLYLSLSIKRKVNADVYLIRITTQSIPIANVQFTLYTVHCIYCTVYSVHYTLNTVHSTVDSDISIVVLKTSLFLVISRYKQPRDHHTNAQNKPLPHLHHP